MNRRKFSTVIAGAVTALFVPFYSNATERFCTVVASPGVSFKVDRNWWERMPMGQWVHFTHKFSSHGKEVIEGRFMLRGEEYAIGFIDDGDLVTYNRRLDSLRFSIKQTILRKDEDAGLTKYKWADVSGPEQVKEYFDECSKYLATSIL